LAGATFLFASIKSILYNITKVLSYEDLKMPELTEETIIIVSRLIDALHFLPKQKYVLVEVDDFSSILVSRNPIYFVNFTFPFELGEYVEVYTFDGRIINETADAVVEVLGKDFRDYRE